MKYESAGNLVGNTPLVKIGTVGNATLWAKLEGHNPTGSLKDRTAHAIIAAEIEANGTGKTMLDASSGSFACALAYFSRIAGVECTVVVNSKISDDNLAFLKTQGANIIKHGTVTGESREKCLDLVRDEPNQWHFTDQLTNPLAPKVHENTTAPEIFRDCPDVSAIFGSKGSGATLCGITRFVETKHPKVLVFGSIGIPGDVKKIAGTYVEGPDFVSPFIEELSGSNSYSGDIPVRYQDAMTACQALPVLVGPQGGGVYTAALTAIQEHGIAGDVVLVMGDSLLKNVSRFT